jgi:hypothetical protein
MSRPSSPSSPPGARRGGGRIPIFPSPGPPGEVAESSRPEGVFRPSFGNQSTQAPIRRTPSGPRFAGPPPPRGRVRGRQGSPRHHRWATCVKRRFFFRPHPARWSSATKARLEPLKEYSSPKLLHPSRREPFPSRRKLSPSRQMDLPSRRLLLPPRHVLFPSPLLEQPSRHLLHLTRRILLPSPHLVLTRPPQQGNRSVTSRPCH